MRDRDRQTDRQTGTDRQTERERHRQTQTDTQRSGREKESLKDREQHLSSWRSAGHWARPRATGE